MKKKYLQFFIALLSIWLFIFQIAPLFSKIQAYQKIQKTIQEKDIDAGALFYTESPNAGAADFYLKKKAQLQLSNTSEKSNN